jgi:hypothetical protein
MTYRTRLAVRLLEGRDAPSGIDTPSPFGGTEPALLGDAPGKGGKNAAPVISDFRAVVGPNGAVTFTGRVSDDTPVAGYVVRITGPGVDATAIVERDGTFRVTTTVNGFVAITVSATATDSGGLRSTPVYTTFTPVP